MCTAVQMTTAAKDSVVDYKITRPSTGTNIYYYTRQGYDSTLPLYCGWNRILIQDSIPREVLTAAAMVSPGDFKIVTIRENVKISPSLQTPEQFLDDAIMCVFRNCHYISDILSLRTVSKFWLAKCESLAFWKFILTERSQEDYNWALRTVLILGNIELFKGLRCTFSHFLNERYITRECITSIITPQGCDYADLFKLLYAELGDRKISISCEVTSIKTRRNIYSLIRHGNIEKLIDEIKEEEIEIRSIARELAKRCNLENLMTIISEGYGISMGEMYKYIYDHSIVYHALEENNIVLVKELDKWDQSDSAFMWYDLKNDLAILTVSNMKLFLLCYKRMYRSKFKPENTVIFRQYEVKCKEIRSIILHQSGVDDVIDMIHCSYKQMNRQELLNSLDIVKKLAPEQLPTLVTNLTKCSVRDERDYVTHLLRNYVGTK